LHPIPSPQFTAPNPARWADKHKTLQRVVKQEQHGNRASLPCRTVIYLIKHVPIAIVASTLGFRPSFHVVLLPNHDWVGGVFFFPLLSWDGIPKVEVPNYFSSNLDTKDGSIRNHNLGLIKQWISHHITREK
ncbi:uncharacterized protein PgNI_02977, partial [Pyricularia grisea]|uniref:Uncharacterized protein n=1 Tax=Pyricularia grisea TaxID=148305 RepID=A0A6P8BD57_PYRGI